jgi:hypothetical protein
LRQERSKSSKTSQASLRLSAYITGRFRASLSLPGSGLGCFQAAAGEAKRAIDQILTETAAHDIGPEFMASPEKKAA